MALPRNLPSNFHITSHAATTTTNSELRVGRLFLHPGSRQTEFTCCPNALPTTASNKCAIYNGPDPRNDALVAYAYGLHMQCDNEHESFTIAFEIDELKRSTLQVMGLGGNSDQWSITGGTGHFTMAQGFIDKTFHNTCNGNNVIELDVYATFRPATMNIWDGPKGADAPNNYQPRYEPRQLESIKIYHNDYICTIEYSYIDRTGTKRTERAGGSDGSRTDIVELGPSEFVKEISGTIGNYAQYTVITSLSIITNCRTLGPYGKASERRFSLPEKKGGRVVGFLGNMELLLTQLVLSCEYDFSVTSVVATAIRWAGSLPHPCSSDMSLKFPLAAVCL